MYKKMLWCKRGVVVEVLRTGHFPNTAMVRLPDGSEIEVDTIELDQIKE